MPTDASRTTENGVLTVTENLTCPDGGLIEVSGPDGPDRYACTCPVCTAPTETPQIIPGADAGDTRKVHELSLPYVAPPLSLNDRRCRQEHAAVVKEARHAAWAVCRAAKLGSHQIVRVTLHYRPGVVYGRKAARRRRDEDNLVASSKPFCDGLIDAGLVPDDTPEHMRKPTPVIHPIIPGARARLWLAVEILDAPNGA